MSRKEEILLVALELAAENGLSNVTMAQIAEKIGIRKPSLYNHFKSKDEIITAMYQYFRGKSKEALSLSEIDYGEFVKGKNIEEALSQAVLNYMNMTGSKNLLLFYKLIYSERAVNSNAAKIMAEETKRMIITTKNLFYALQAHGKINAKDIDMTAVSFAMTIHSIMDYQFDCSCCGESGSRDMIQKYIKWFCNTFGGISDEKNID